MSDPILIYPNHHKFTSPEQKNVFSTRWKTAFDLLHGNGNEEPVDKWTFIGYSMPQTDGEAMGLFAYADYYHSDHDYKISVINPDPGAIKNFAFFRKEITYYRLTLEDYLKRFPENGNS